MRIAIRNSQTDSCISRIKGNFCRVSVRRNLVGIRPNRHCFAIEAGFIIETFNLTNTVGFQKDAVQLDMSVRSPLFMMATSEGRLNEDSG